jgi:hypothetical protein
MSCAGRLAGVLALLSLGLAGCGTSSQPEVQCPQVVKYTDAQLDAIQASINRLPKNDPLRGAMSDYEQLRDDARYCSNLLKERAGQL